MSIKVPHAPDLFSCLHEEGGRPAKPGRLILTGSLTLR